ncbi:hypothetical protein [Longimonas halophila]|nr:hypothetical protein [Longimonas halophila]
MDPDSTDYWNRVHAHIDALLDRPIEEHEVYLDEHCPNAKMRRDVKSWLAYIYTPTDVLDESVATYARTLLDDTPPPERPPLWNAGVVDAEDSSSTESPPAAPSSSRSVQRWMWVSFVVVSMIVAGALVLWWHADA